jgi:hypothetical protein
MDSRPSDETLLLAVAERDMGAFRTLYERHADWLAIRLARRCNDRDLVADAIGDSAAAREACATALGGPRRRPVGLSRRRHRAPGIVPKRTREPGFLRG